MSSVNALISFSHFWAISEQVLQHGRVPSPLPSESAIIGGVYLVWNSVGQQNIALYRDEQCYSFHQLALSMMWLIMHTCV